MTTEYTNFFGARREYPAAAPTRVQITTTYTSNNGVGRIRATMSNGEHARKYVTLPVSRRQMTEPLVWVHHFAAATKLATRFGLTGAITYGGTTNQGGTIFNVAT